MESKVGFSNRPEPAIKRAVAFFDGQNLYHHAKAAFGYHHPNYDPKKLFDAVCAMRGYRADGVRFYTGRPNQVKEPMWAGYWAARLLAMRRSGILVTDRPLRYRSIDAFDEHGAPIIKEVPEEKGIDVRIALDVVRLARSNQYDVGVIFSQDQDLSEVANDVREIGADQGRWIKIASAYPTSSTATAGRGLDKTDWIPIERDVYDQCIDPRDYRPKSKA